MFISVTNLGQVINFTQASWHLSRSLRLHHSALSLPRCSMRRRAPVGEYAGKETCCVSLNLPNPSDRLRLLRDRDSDLVNYWEASQLELLPFFPECNFGYGWELFQGWFSHDLSWVGCKDAWKPCAQGHNNSHSFFGGTDLQALDGDPFL